MHKVLNYLRGHDWPIPDGTFEELTLEHPINKIGLLRNESAWIRGLYQLRPITGMVECVFLIDASNQSRLSRYTVRRIAKYFTSRPISRRPRHRYELEQMLFLVLCKDAALYVCHFEDDNALRSKMASMGPFGISTFSDVAALLWDNIELGGARIGEETYFRRERRPDGFQCTREFLRQYAPDHIPLFKSVLKTRQIAQAEEDYLFARVRSGDRKALSRVVHLNLRKVFDIASSIFRAYAACEPCFDEIFASALEGLMWAIEDYDPARSHRFASYAWSRIHQKANQGLVSGLYPIIVPGYLLDQIAPAIKACTEAEISYSDPSDPAIVEAFGLDAAQSSLLTSLVEGFDRGVPSRLTQRRDDEEAARRIFHIDASLEFASIVRRLRRRDADVLLYRLGMHPDDIGTVYTLAEIGQIYALTRERVRQIELRALRKIRDVWTDLY